MQPPEDSSMRHLNDEAGGALAFARTNQNPVRLRGEIRNSVGRAGAAHRNGIRGDHEAKQESQEV